MSASGFVTARVSRRHDAIAHLLIEQTNMAYRYQTIEAPQEADVMSKLLVGGLAFVATVCFGVATIEYVSPNSLFVAPVASPAVGIYGPQVSYPLPGHARANLEYPVLSGPALFGSKVTWRS